MARRTWWQDPKDFHVFMLSAWCSVLTLMAAGAGITAYSLSNFSVIIYAFGVQNIIDLLSSIVIMWRFYAPRKNYLPERYLAMLKGREKRAQVAIAFIMIFMSLMLSVAALKEFKLEGELDQDLETRGKSVLLIVSFPTACVYTWFAVVKYMCSIKMESHALMQDAYCSGFGAFLAGSSYINTHIISRNPDLWMLNPIAAFSVSAVSLLLGMMSLLRNKYQDAPFCTLLWWITSPRNENEVELREISGLGGQNIV